MQYQKISPIPFDQVTGLDYEAVTSQAETVKLSQVPFPQLNCKAFSKTKQLMFKPYMISNKSRFIWFTDCLFSVSLSSLKDRHYSIRSVNAVL